MKRIQLWAFVALIGLSLVSWISPANLPGALRKLMADKATSVITYSMKHPMHAWEGTSRDVNCAVMYDDQAQRLTSVAVVVKVSTFDSGNANRDSHAIEAMEGIKYPNVSFTSQEIEVGTNGNMTIKGNLTFHGVAKPMVVQATSKTANGKMTVEGGFDFKLTDFKVERPSLMMVAVEDEVKMKFSIAFKI